jgi:hypothetical protein
MELYKTVAEQDPEWYEEFVRNILQEDILESGEKNGESDKASEDNEANGESDTANEDGSSSILKFESERRKQPQALSVSIEEDLSPVEEEEKVIIDDLIGEEEEEAKIEDDFQLEVEEDESIDEARDISGSMDLPVDELPIEEDLSPVEEEEEVITDELIGEEDENILYEARDMSGSMDLLEDELPVEKAEAFQLEVQEEEVLSKEEIESMVESTVQDMEAEVQNEKTTGPEKPQAVPEAINGGPMPDDTTSARPSVVVYRDLYTGTLLVAPLKALTRLGYVAEEVLFLQPDALSLILDDKIAKPRRGVPQQWKVSPSQKKVLQDDVRIMTKDQAKEILESSKSKKQPQRTLERDQEVPKRRRPREEDEDPKRRKRRPTAEQDAEARQRVRNIGEQQRRPNTEKKVRPTLSNDRGDPPTPVNPVWVDINTFRDLLRREAEMRVRILGSDWKKTVKEESKWRLDLYKEWLWSLSDGVGDPIVERRVPSAAARPRRDTPKADASPRRETSASPRREARAQRTSRTRPEADASPRREARAQRTPETSREADPSLRRETRAQRSSGAGPERRAVLDPRNKPKSRSTKDSGTRRTASARPKGRRTEDEL